MPLDLHRDFSGHQSGGLIFYWLQEFSTWPQFVSITWGWYKNGHTHRKMMNMSLCYFNWEHYLSLHNFNFNISVISQLPHRDLENFQGKVWFSVLRLLTHISTRVYWAILLQNGTLAKSRVGPYKVCFTDKAIFK